MKYHLSLFLILFSGIAVFGQDSPIIVSLFHPDHNYGETEWEREAFPEIEEVFEGQAFHGVIYEEEPLEAYLKQVLDRILPEELNQFNIRIYIKKAPSFNAGMFMDGRLVLNTGALAAMETEGELAYLMAHELSHFILRHGIRNMRRLDQGLENLSRRRREEEVHDMNTRLALYNQRLETEA
ncbi:MAG: M48 family metalloprotease, partial [Bacteroidota bacterium]